MRSIWIHPSDLDGRDPARLAAELRGLGLDAVGLAMKYHGGRMLLPRSPRGPARDLDPGGVFFPPTASRYDRLVPRPAEEAALVGPFVEACMAEGVAVGGWTVVCHDDRLGEEHPDCCVRNLFGDRYRYALCPSHPDVRRYAGALCADVAATPGVERLELEALSFMGYDHASLHDKSGIPLAPVARWLLSLCACDACRGRIGAPLAEAVDRGRRALEAHFADPFAAAAPTDLREGLEAVLGAELLEAVLAGRRAVVASLLDAVRQEAGGAHLNLRLSPDPLFIGGKSALGWDDLPGRADSATVTFFGAPAERMAAEVDRLPEPGRRPVPVHGGFVFHGPDCASAADVRHRLYLLREARVDGLSFYSYGMAAEPQLHWLSDAIASELPPGDRPPATHDHAFA